ncbi:PQQ-dependent sugar dehydrogenase [Rathayibacter sp. VKM Ac-2856]|uniref:PQQ-dependent sugar dehydrogenase n=1 Tax=unclassified Rathayibacter TaxID=2609250 RepID=UPI001564485A|nr:MULTISPECIES: PQQ-dependent sugar dehydrogenase [unclassified Rathayibacter]NQX04964.1 PQQ-dependent sugar dehydrogenase [Rathayibacter sp. VKM Ac-2858]NQX20132.1 PQQ-dependent sugar dehydrogenase [Rathayibacter sp. VKM Ac-2856]
MTRPVLRSTLVGAALALGAGLASCSTTPAAPGPDARELVGASSVAEGLEAPWSVVFVDDGATGGGTALVSERDSGRILELGADGGDREIGVVEGVVAEGESGLLGLAVDGRTLFAYSTGADGNRIQSFALEGGPGSYSLGAPETVLDGIPAARTHDGGRIAIGPDGMLYATVGDAGRREAAQDLDELSGKILRMTLDGTVPEDNPYPGSLVWSSGHRNPQGLAWAEDGTLFASEFGQDTWDELNVIEPGADYGWPEVEGIAGEDGFVDPVQQWEPSAASPSGMAEVDGVLYLANLRGEVLRAVPVADPSASTDYAVGEHGRLRDAVAAPDGSLWFVTSNTDGRGSPGAQDDRILRVEPPS